RFGADDEIDVDVGLAGRDALVLVAGRDLDDAANGERRRVLPRLRQQVQLDARVQIADVVAAPRRLVERIPVDDAADRAVVAEEERPQVTVDARVEEEGAEDLGAIADADRQGPRKVADVGETLNVVRPAPVPADRPLTVGEYFGSRYVPQPGIAEE